jgi:hypothetical protein
MGLNILSALSLPGNKRLSSDYQPGIKTPESNVAGKLIVDDRRIRRVPTTCLGLSVKAALPITTVSAGAVRGNAGQEIRRRYPGNAGPSPRREPANDYAVCESGKYRFPVNIGAAHSADLYPLQLQYQQFPFRP